jgi:hypothetical protein
MARFFSLSSISSSRDESSREKDKISSSSSSLASNPNSTIIEKLKCHLNNLNLNQNIPLFKDFEIYSSSFPVRRLSDTEYLKLPFYAKKGSFDQYVEKLKVTLQGPRSTVKYISAPTGSGKSSSILPAFVQSIGTVDGAGVYLYLSFASNRQRHFEWAKGKPNANLEIAKRQGAAFICHCVKILLEHPNDLSKYNVTETFPAAKVPTVDDDSLYDFQEYINDKFGKGVRIWFHCDEYRCTCDSSIRSRANFSLGALETLSLIDNAKVIATYTNMPNEVPPVSTSGACRFGVPLPPLDIDQVMVVVPEFYFDIKLRKMKT